MGHDGKVLAGGLVIVLALLGAACGGSDGDGDDIGGGERVDRRRQESPLDEYFGPMSEASRERMAEQGRRVEAAVAECMEAQGFEYTPIETDFSEFEEGPWSLPDKEFVERYGFGMFTIDHEEGSGRDDPNQERVDAMSEAEQIAYNSALYGEYDEETGESISGGCQGQAWDAEETGDEDEFQGLFDDMEGMRRRIERDDRVKEAAGDWADCMADAGYPDVKEPSSVSGLVQDRYDEMNPEVEEPEPSEDGEATSAGSAVLSGDYGLDAADLEELRAYEIEVALADYECRAEYDRVYFEVETEVEQEFLDEHREELERYRDAQASTGAG